MKLGMKVAVLSVACSAVRISVLADIRSPYAYMTLSVRRTTRLELIILARAQSDDIHAVTRLGVSST